MSYPKFCKDCSWSKPEENSEWNLRCHEPHVNCKDEWALASVKTNGSNCVSERAMTWISFPACGKQGKLYEPRTTGLTAV